MASIDAVWTRIESHAGETFHLKRGRPFTYSVSRSAIAPDTVNRTISRGEISKALDVAPLSGPGKIQHLQAPSFVYAILTDKRIAGG